MLVTSIRRAWGAWAATASIAAYARFVFAADKADDSLRFAVADDGGAGLRVKHVGRCRICAVLFEKRVFGLFGAAQDGGNAV